MNDKREQIEQIKKRISELHEESNKYYPKGKSQKNDDHSEVNAKILKQILRNEKEEKVDDISDIDNHKQTINKKIVEELNFKSKAKVWSVVIMLIISMAIMSNLFIVLYWNPLNFDYKIILGLITATFANLFALIMVVFKYVFSPTKEMLDYNSSLIKNDDENN